MSVQRWRRANVQVLLTVIGLMLFAGCGDGREAPQPDVSSDDDTAPADVQTDTAPEGDSGEDGDAEVSPVARGEYLVRHVAACGVCHTPLDAEGQAIDSMFLAGRTVFFDLAPEDDTKGKLTTPNLTSDATGLRHWSDAEIRRALQQGIGRDGRILYATMPSYLYSHLSESDVSAIIAYLRTVAPVANEVPVREPLPFPWLAAPSPVDDALIPHTTLSPESPDHAAAEHGRYLATIGGCLFCHTPPDQGQGLQMELAFAGGRRLRAEAFGLAVPPNAEVFETPNLTAHESGLAGWTARQFSSLLRLGLDAEGQPVCRGMPAGPMGAFGGLSEEDALAIGHYLTTIPGVSNGPFFDGCSGP